MTEYKVVAGVGDFRYTGCEYCIFLGDAGLCHEPPELNCRGRNICIIRRKSMSLEAIIQKEIQRLVTDQIVAEQMDGLEAKLREKIKPIVEGLKVDTINRLFDHKTITEKLNIAIRMRD